jgi:cobalamin-dependent methionine synthase I
MGRIRGVLKRRPSLGKRAVVSCVQGDNHLIGARVIADFLYFDGWDVDFLGIDTPTEDLKQFVKDRKSDLVGLSCSTTDLLTVLHDAAKGVKEVDPRIRVLAGGAAISQDRAAQLKGDGIDEVGFSVDDSCDKARQLVGLPLVATNLEQVLKEIGERLTFHRKARRFTQQQVAELSGLDRAYISAVEHGKHNLTLGALIKLADALEVGIEEVILGGASDNGPKSKA